mmetsp:Transcript_43012/g.91687  ORF Transcript_43012/g.91687 Transcript_43012/m.91687 type:complete len:249 (+) Transcript_43012:245-991(+)
MMKPKACTEVNTSWKSTAAPSRVRPAFRGPTSWPPMAPRSFTTHKADKLRQQALTQERAKSRQALRRSGPEASCVMGSKPSAYKDQASMKAALGKKIQAKRVQGSELAPSCPRSSSSCNTAFTARDTLARRQSATPTVEKPFTTPFAHMQVPITTKHTGPKRNHSKGCLLSSITPILTTGVVAETISVKETEQNVSAALLLAMDIELATEMGTILPKNSGRLGRSMGCLAMRALQRSIANAITVQLAK